jgi:hypothetical protein
MCNDAAAAENEPCSTADRKYASCWSVIGRTLRWRSQSRLPPGAQMDDNSPMVAILSLIGAIALGGLAVRHGVEQRPGFDERPEAR